MADTELVRQLARLGGELVSLQLLESPKLAKPATEVFGARNPEVERVSWTNNTVWLDKAQTIGFKGVREKVWNFHIGGYQVCEKWLKDRKGRTLLKDDIAHYQKIVVAISETLRLMKETDEVIEQYGGWPGAFQTSAAQTSEAKAAPAMVLPFRPRTVETKPAERCVLLVPLKAAAGAFSDPQHIQQKGWDDDFEWVAVEPRHRLRQGKTVLAQIREATDPETCQCCTVRCYESEKAAKGDSWRHQRITFRSVNPDSAPIVLAGRDEGELQVIAELVEVLRSEA